MISPRALISMKFLTQASWPCPSGFLLDVKPAPFIVVSVILMHTIILPISFVALPLFYGVVGAFSHAYTHRMHCPWVMPREAGHSRDNARWRDFRETNDDERHRQRQSVRQAGRKAEAEEEVER